MNYIDLPIINFLNQFAQHSWVIDRSVLFLSGFHFLKGGILVTLMWFAWFQPSELQERNRVHIVLIFFSCFVGMVIARGMALMFPFRFRPVHDHNLIFIPPHGMDNAKLEFEGLSSFPSDHAVLFFAMSFGMLFVSRKIGIFAIVYTLIFIALPRIYLGLHYPTDILGGAIIGVAISFLVNRYLIQSHYLKSVMRFSTNKPEFFYPLFFIITYQVSDMFEEMRRVIKVGYEAFKIFI